MKTASRTGISLLLFQTRQQRFTDCASGVCSLSHCRAVLRTYIGWMGRCLNVHLRKLCSYSKGTPSTSLSLHCRQYGCEGDLNRTAVGIRYREQRTCEIAGALEITKTNTKCLSQPSSSLTNVRDTYRQHMRSDAWSGSVTLFSA